MFCFDAGALAEALEQSREEADRVTALEEADQEEALRRSRLEAGPLSFGGSQDQVWESVVDTEKQNVIIWPVREVK